MQEESMSRTKAKQTAADKTKQFRAQLDTQAGPGRSSSDPVVVSARTAHLLTQLVGHRRMAAHGRWSGRPSAGLSRAHVQVQELQRRKIPSPMTEAERRINKQILQDIAKLRVSHEAGFTIPAGH